MKCNLSVPFLAALTLAACRSQSAEPAPASPQAGSTPVEVRVLKDHPSAPVLAEKVPGAAEAPMANGKLLAKVGELAPNFALEDLDGKKHTLAEQRGKYVVLEWFSPACPTCQMAYAQGVLKTMPEEYMKSGIVWLSVNSEAGTRKAASVEENKKFVDAYGLKAPILLDPTGVVGRSFGAKSTPHMFVIDPKGVLVYQGALDNAPGGRPADGAARIDYVGDALAASKAGRKVEVPETKSYG